jgi:hypothetical protein
MNCLWNVHLKWGMSVANIIKNAYLIVIMSLNDLSVVNKTKKRPLFSVLKIKCCSSYTVYRNEIGCFTNYFNIYHGWSHSPFLRKKVMMIRKLSISRSIYLLKRCVSFLLITTGYTSHVLFFTTECCDFGDRQPCFWKTWLPSSLLTTWNQSHKYWTGEYIQMIFISIK